MAGKPLFAESTVCNFNVPAELNKAVRGPGPGRTPVRKRLYPPDARQGDER
jgi:hypothetical protein